MVVLLAIGVVGDDVEVRGREGLRAGFADEALFVPAAGQAAVGGFDGFALDGLGAAAADGFVAAGCRAAGERSGRGFLRDRWGFEGGA